MKLRSVAHRSPPAVCAAWGSGAPALGNSTPLLSSSISQHSLSYVILKMENTKIISVWLETMACFSKLQVFLDFKLRSFNKTTFLVLIQYFLTCSILSLVLSVPTGTS